MPLRDHFHPPVEMHSSWEGFHGGWPMKIVEELNKVLPEGYSAEPRVRQGTHFEVDVGALDHSDLAPKQIESLPDENGGIATATWAPPTPTLIVETDPFEEYEYEVRIYDLNFGRTLVAAIELVSPANKDPPAAGKPSSQNVPPCSNKTSLSHLSIW